jgi:predicted transcriptional regulator
MAKAFLKKIGTESGGDGCKFAVNEEFISAAQIAERLNVSRMTAFRLMQRESVTRACVGKGKNGTVRFSRKEVEIVIERISFKPQQQR